MESGPGSPASASAVSGSKFTNLVGSPSPCSNIEDLPPTPLSLLCKPAPDLFPPPMLSDMSLLPRHGVPTHGAPTDWSRVVRRLTLEAKAHVLPYRGRNPPSSIVASILKQGSQISDDLRAAAKCSDPLVAADATACLGLVESACANLSGLLPKTEVQKHEAPATPPHRPVWSTPILHLFPLTAALLR
jgi:hypothetical protein